MNKEIKFRAWDEQNKVMHNDFQFIKSGNAGNDWVVFISDKQPINSSDGSIWHNNPYFQQQLKIMQFTGLKDKNGKEIYEGDVLKPTNPNGEEMDSVEVKWNESACTYPFEDDFDGYDLTSIGWAIEMEYAFEVVGNIYETPELLK